MSELSSALYRLRVAHHRLQAPRHSFAYEIGSLLLDLDELPHLDRDLRLFAWNGRGTVAHWDRDHGPHDGTPLRSWVERRLAEEGITFEVGAIRLLAMPRVMGTLFNPLGIYYCHGANGALRAAIYEVHNTFGQHHSYVLPVRPGEAEQSCEKDFYVSPFIAMQQRYRFRLAIPGEALAFSMRQDRDRRTELVVTMRGERQPLGDPSLARLALTQPLMGWKVLSAIHWQALRLWIKGAPYHSRHAAGMSNQRTGRPATGMERKVP